jgi:hypothetical protein
MPKCFEPALDVLPAAQREIWPRLAPAPHLSLVLYGGTAIALHLGHRASIDFDFFSSETLRKEHIRRAFGMDAETSILQDSVDTLVASVRTSSGPVKLSFFGNLGIGRVSEPLQTADGTLLVASLDDLLATKLNAILDRAESKDYRDIAAMLRQGMSLAAGLAAFQVMFAGEPAQVLRAIGYFDDGDLASLSTAERAILTNARDSVRSLPHLELASKNLAIAPGDCDEIIPSSRFSPQDRA